MFGSAKEAKDFFVARIVEQAARETVALTEPERIMLHFTEQGDFDAPLDVIQQFEEQFDSDEYESKIARLLANAYKHDVEQAKKSGGPYSKEMYQAAYEVLRKEDHYILVMINQSIGDQLRKKFLGFF